MLLLLIQYLLCGIAVTIYMRIKLVGAMQELGLPHPKNDSYDKSTMLLNIIFWPRSIWVMIDALRNPDDYENL